MTFKTGTKTITTVEGLNRSGDEINIEQATSHVILIEQTLEKLLGYRVHITSEVIEEDPTTSAGWYEKITGRPL